LARVPVEIGRARAARSARAGRGGGADGYTLLFAASANINLTPQLQKLNFDPLKATGADRRHRHADDRNQGFPARKTLPSPSPLRKPIPAS
jgi:hypothetical protein